MLCKNEFKLILIVFLCISGSRSCLTQAELINIITHRLRVSVVEHSVSIDCHISLWDYTWALLQQKERLIYNQDKSN